MLIPHLARLTRRLLFWTLITIALLVSVVRIFLADVIGYKPEVEQKILEMTQLPVRIGALSTRMRGFSPAVVLEDVSIGALSPQGKQPIRLKQVRVGIDLLQLLWTRDPVSASWVSLVGANIDLIRNLDGSISVKGLQGGDEQPLWLLQGSRYEILQSDINWLDLKNNGKQVRFSHVDLVLKNSGENHEIHLLTNLPEKFGNTLRISALIKGNVFSADNLEGQLYVEGVNLQAPAWVNGEDLSGFSIESGAGDIRLWSQWQNSRLSLVTGYLQAQQIRINNSQGKHLQLDTMDGNISWHNKQGAWLLSAYDIDMVANRQRWSDNEFYLQRDSQGNWSGLIKQLELQALAHFAPLFVDGENSDAEWLGLNPSGKITDFSGYMQNDGQHYALQGRFSQLGSNAKGSLPGIRGLSGWIGGSDSHGWLAFDSEEVKIDALDMFRNSLTVKRLRGGMDWEQHAEAWLMRSKGLQMDSPDFQTETEFDLSLPKDRTAATLNLLTRFGHFTDIAKVRDYLPAKAMGKEAVAWLDDAFVAGRIDHGELVVQGKLDQFPFANGQGRFETLFTIENGEVQFNANWPHLREVNADVRFHGEDLRVAIAGGRSENVDIKQAVVDIAKVAVSDHLTVNGQVHASINNALHFLQKTPLHKHVDTLPKILASDSETQVDLDLRIPYYETDPVRVNVNAHLNNARLTVKPVDMLVNNVNGVVNFTEDRVTGEKLSASTLGFPIQASLSSDNTATRLKIDGSTSVDNLQKQFSFLKNSVSEGSFAYQTELTIPHGDALISSLSISSTLQGVRIDGQDMLGKAAEEQRPLRLDFQFDNKDLLPLQLHYGNDLNAAMLIDTGPNKLHSAHIVVGRQEAASLQQAGMSIEVRLPQFKLSQALGALAGGDGRWPVLREVLLETDELIWQGRNLGAIRCHFQHLDQAWQGNIDTAMAKGSINLPDQRSSDQPIKLEMDYLNLSAMSALNFNAAEEDFTVLPLIDIDSQKLLWRTVNLGKLKLQTERLNNGIHFKKIKLSGANKDINFTADWIKQLHGTTTLINGSLSMDGFGQFLAELGYSEDFKETHAEISFTGGWNDAPQQFALDRLNGQMQIKLSDGRISSIEPGFGRLLGLISMEQWAKRLSLDFSDIFRQGLSFDKITGDFKITNGVAYTDNLLIDAAAAKMMVAGTANLNDKTLDHRVAVVPKSSDALPIAGTIVGGIAAVITNVVTGDYKEGYFFGSEYKVSGRWGNVEVTPINDHGGLLNKTWHGLTDFGWLK